MEQGDNSIPQESPNSEEFGFTSRERLPQPSEVPQRSRLARFVLQKLDSISNYHRRTSNAESHDAQRETTSYTLDQFSLEQFERARAEFCAWYEVGQSPDTATDHPLVVARFGDTLDPEDAASIFVWWTEGCENLMNALSELRQLLDDECALDDDEVESLLTITSNTESGVGHLLDCLDWSRLEEA